MPRSRKRKPKAVHPDVRRRPDPQPSAAPTTVALALHDLPDAASQRAAVSLLEEFASAVETGRERTFSSHLDNRSDYVLTVELADGRTLLDSSTSWSAIEEGGRDALMAAARSWRSVARHCLNPALGFRAGTPKPVVDAIVAGFARVGDASDDLRDYVAASLSAHPLPDDGEGRPDVDALLRLPSPTTAAECSFWTSNLFGVPTEVDEDFSAAMEEASARFAQSTPMAWRLDVPKPWNPDDVDDVRNGVDHAFSLVVSRLEMRHERVGPCGPTEAMRIMAKPRLRGMSFVLHARPNPQDAPDDLLFLREQDNESPPRSAS